MKFLGEPELTFGVRFDGFDELRTVLGRVEKADRCPGLGLFGGSVDDDAVDGRGGGDSGEQKK